MVPHLLMAMLVMGLVVCKREVLQPYADCEETSRVFCVGYHQGRLSFQPRSGLTFGEETCVDDETCAFLFKAIREDDNDTVTFRIYVHSIQASWRIRAFVGLTREPVTLTTNQPFNPTIDFMSLFINERDKTLAGRWGKLKNQQQGHDTLLTFTGQGDKYQLTRVVDFGHDKENAFGVDMVEFQSKLRDGDIDFTGPVSISIATQTITYWINETVLMYTGVPNIGHVTTQQPAILMWTDSHSVSSESRVDEGLPVWAIAVICIVSLLLLFLVIFVCCYAGARSKEQN